MKPILIIIILHIAFVRMLFAQNASFYYQGVARNAQGVPLAGATIAVRLSLREAINAGDALYSETKSVTTNAFGLYSISINDGTGSKTGDFNAIDWSTPRYLQTEIDPANGTAFVNMGTQQMQSIPHALSAKNLDGVANPQNGDLLEFQNGMWITKPKPKRYHVVGGLGLNPSFNLNFIGVKTSIVIEKDNPIITINLTKAIGSSLYGGASALTVNLGYQKAGSSVNEFDVPDQNNIGRITNLRVPSGTRLPLTLSGTYQTNFKAGEIYDIGIVGFSSDASQWNDSGFCKGFIEVSY